MWLGRKMADEAVEILFSSSEISEENNLKWLGKVSKEQNSTSVPEELVSYVKNLSCWMKYKETSEVLRKLPSVGKLLSNLSKLCKNNSEGVLPTAVLECIVNLSKLPGSLHHSSSNTKKKATEWAINQLQFITLPNIPGENAKLNELFGITTSEVVSAQIKEVTSLCQSLIQDCSTNGNSYDLKKLQSNSKILYDISQCIAPMIAQCAWRILIEILLLSQETSIGHFNSETGNIENSLCQEFLVAVTNNQDLIENLSYRSIVCLWRCHLPAFENEVFKLIEEVVRRPYLSDSHVLLIVNSHEKLVSACSNYEMLRGHAFYLLRQMLSNVSGLPCLMSLVNILQICIKQAQTKNGDHSMYISPVKALYSLPVVSSGLALKDNEKAVDFIADELKFLFMTQQHASHNVDKHTICFELLKNRHWVDVAKMLIFQGSNSCINSCLVVMCLFYLFTLDSELLGIFKSLVRSLRCLKSMKLLQMADIKCLIDSTKTTNGKHDITPLTRDLILTFLALANGSHFILREAFSMVTEDLSYDYKLDIWLRTLESVFSLPTSNNSLSEKTKLSDEKRETMTLFLNCLSERTVAKFSKTSEDEHADGKSSESGKDIDDLQNRTLKCISRLKES